MKNFPGRIAAPDQSHKSLKNSLNNAFSAPNDAFLMTNYRSLRMNKKKAGGRNHLRVT
jgi:hypothetical protein